MKSYLSVRIVEQDVICLDGSVELSMSCMCMGNSYKYRCKLGPVHNADDQVYSISKVQNFLNNLRKAGLHFGTFLLHVNAVNSVAN